LARADGAPKRVDKDAGVAIAKARGKAEEGVKSGF
jgi:hypothetical protein